MLGAYYLVNLIVWDMEGAWPEAPDWMNLLNKAEIYHYNINFTGVDNSLVKMYVLKRSALNAIKNTF